MADRELARVRAACLALPEVVERLSHGSPSFFVRVRLDRDPDWDEVTAICAEAYRTVAPERLVAQLDAPA